MGWSLESLELHIEQKRERERERKERERERAREREREVQSSYFHSPLTLTARKRRVGLSARGA